MAERTHADQRRLHWAEDYWTNEDIQTETTAFYKLNSEVGAPTGHATGHAPFGADSARSEDARINRQRADDVIKRLGPDADPDHVRMVEAHYGVGEPARAVSMDEQGNRYDAQGNLIDQNTGNDSMHNARTLEYVPGRDDTPPIDLLYRPGEDPGTGMPVDTNGGKGDIQTETAFYKLNSEVGAPTGHATGHAPFGADSARSEDARINRQRADHAIKSLGPDADPDHVRLVEAHYGLLPKQESQDTLGGTDGTDTFGGGDGDDSLIGGSGHDDLSEGSEVPNDQTQPAPTPEDESYFDRKTYRQAIEEQRLASWLAGGGQRIADNLSEAYDQWDPKWSDLYEIPGSMLRSFSNDIKDAIENPEDPSKTLPLALEATGLGGAFSRLPKALPDGDVLGMSGGRGTFQGTKKTWTQPRAPRPGEWEAPDGDLDTGDMEVIDLLNQGGSRPGQPATGNRNPGGIHNPDGIGVAHADRRHVVTEEYLDHRIRTDEKSKGVASTYINQDFANKATTPAVRNDMHKAKRGKHGKYEIVTDLNMTIGYVKGSKTKRGGNGETVYIPHGKPQPTSRVKVVFSPDSSRAYGVHIITSYPVLP
ncbi:RNase A-like domain-containing protein [Magnetospira sp. QH-2]|uniref:RNase A-like domain-containing protein n=1 Tax=Magnetospira sp. (strain QH-2) TaxID=1288970 RepID=UPI0003E81BEA|nr:RNase A-like domain-containing protein [Magnetospira sp. QH-2]CCQ73170.1 protein of unknown function [Magnetospira sp. QH-2]